MDEFLGLDGRLPINPDGGSSPSDTLDASGLRMLRCVARPERVINSRIAV